LYLSDPKNLTLDYYTIIKPKHKVVPNRNQKDTTYIVVFIGQ